MSFYDLGLVIRFEGLGNRRFILSADLSTNWFSRDRTPVGGWSNQFATNPSFFPKPCQNSF